MGELILQLAGNPVFVLIATLLTLVTLAGACITLFLLITGLCRPMVRLGLSRARQNICVVGAAEASAMVMRDLAGSCVVPKRRLKELSIQSLEEIDDDAILVVCADGMSDEDVLRAIGGKGKKAGAIVYTSRKIDQKTVTELNGSQHVSLVNMRGRLINEIMALYMTTKTPARRIEL